MNPSRETIFSALFGLLSEATWDIGTIEVPKPKSFVTKSRKIVLFSDVPDAQQPWVGQAEHGETAEKGTRLPYKWSLAASWVIYHRGGAIPGVIPSVWNNLILDAVEKILAPKPQDPGYFDERNTLSGLVHHCFISGEVFKDPGDIDKQALISVPIKILVP